MKHKFSERKGFKETLTVIQKDGMSEELRSSLWNVLDLIVWRSTYSVYAHASTPGIEPFSKSLWFGYFKEPIDSRPDRPHKILAKIRDYFFSCEWREVYAEELADDKFAGVQEHLRTALRLLSDRENPDYRNSIKESISAVESLAKAVTGKKKASLSDALAELEKRGHLHPALKQAFVKSYAWASDAGGIRHAMLEVSDLTAADAKYMLLACTSFINYLKAKL